MPVQFCPQTILGKSSAASRGLVMARPVGAGNFITLFVLEKVNGVIERFSFGCCALCHVDLPPFCCRAGPPDGTVKK